MQVAAQRLDRRGERVGRYGFVWPHSCSPHLYERSSVTSAAPESRQSKAQFHVELRKVLANHGQVELTQNRLFRFTFQQKRE